MSERAALAELTLDPSLYPRKKGISEQHVAELRRALEAGQELPPIVAERKSRRIVDGWHRYHAAGRNGASHILVDFRDYPSEAELFREAVLLNTAHGMKLDNYDKVHVIAIGDGLGLKDLDLGVMLRIPATYVLSLRQRFATVEELVEGVSEERRVALKASVRHLYGARLTLRQEQAIASAPGQSYLLGVRQLIDALEQNLLPPRDQHPTLWSELQRLATLIAGAGLGGVR